MPRTRGFRPELLTDERFSELSSDHVLVFVGLLTQADFRGRLEDRPKALRVRLLPYGDGDFNQLLQDLADHDEHFIRRYEVAGKRYIAIRDFTTDPAWGQNPHKREVEAGSDFPGPEDANRPQAGPGPGQAGTGTGLGRAKVVASPADPVPDPVPDRDLDPRRSPHARAGRSEAPNGTGSPQAKPPERPQKGARRAEARRGHREATQGPPEPPRETAEAPESRGTGPPVKHKPCDACGTACWHTWTQGAWLAIDHQRPIGSPCDGSPASTRPP